MDRTLKHPLTAFREANKIDQQDAAKLFGITQSMLSQLENWRTYASPRVAKRISDITGVALDVLLNFSDSGSSPRPDAPSAAATENSKDVA